MVTNMKTNSHCEEIQGIVDGLVVALLAASPRNADLPVVKQARKLLGTFPHNTSSAALAAFETQPGEDSPVCFIKGYD